MYPKEAPRTEIGITSSLSRDREGANGARVTRGTRIGALARQQQNETAVEMRSGEFEFSGLNKKGGERGGYAGLFVWVWSGQRRSTPQ